MLEVGKLIGERYKIISLLGTGGMASVYLAKDLILERQVAVKVLRFDFSDNNDAKRRFQREAQAATQLVHPNIVGVLDVGEEQGIQYIVMEYVEGTDLKDFVRNRGPLPPREAVRIMSQVVSAIATAHHNRIIHRDIKPQNILIDRSGNVKITDFGIAIALSETSLTQTNTLLGSVHYLSPEQARGSMATTRSDIYALGVVLYELLSGTVPFDGESAVSIALKHFQEPLPRLSQLLPTIPQSLENVVLKATAKDIHHRYADCDQMLEDLATCLNPERLKEPMYQPQGYSGETKVLKPIQTAPRTVAPSSADLPEVKMEEVVPVPPKYNPPKKKKRRIFPWLFLLLILGLGSLFAYYYSTMPAEVKVMDVSGKLLAEARVLIEGQGLVVSEVIEVPSDQVASGTVIETTPGAGTTVREGAKILIKVSKGQSQVLLKDYSQTSYDTARAELISLGFQVKKMEEYSDTVPSGQVIRQTPKADASVVAKDTTVTLTVSKGKKPITLPNLIGYSRAALLDYANQNGLNVDITESASEASADTVIEQNPHAGSSIDEGGTLYVTISKGLNERTVTKEFTIPYQAPSTSTTTTTTTGEDTTSATVAQTEGNVVEIYIDDAHNSIDTLYQTMTITQTTNVTITFNLNDQYPSASYRILKDGKLIESGKVQ